jgi:hypothetical protein
MMRRLADLHRDGWAALQRLETYNEPNTYTRGIYRRPTNRQMVRFLAQTYGYRVQQKVLGALQEQWVIAFRRRGTDDRFTIVDPPAGHFYADPSYPSLFQWRGEWFMIPETGARRRVEIWRARRFPDEWELERVALDGVDACDATVCAYDDRWWMFVTLCVPGGPRADEVSLFHADTPLGSWQAHRANPVVSDAGHARSAGALYREGDALIRPSQDVRSGYGHAVTLSRIDRLTPREFHETPIGAVRPSWHRRVRGTHTIARSERFEVVDGRLLRFRRRRP